MQKLTIKEHKAQRTWVKNNEVGGTKGSGRRNFVNKMTTCFW